MYYNENYDDELAEAAGRVDADESDGNPREDEVREKNRRNSRDSQDNTRHGEGREKNSQFSSDGDKNRVLLKAVNDVLNQFFPLKTIISAVEFEVFREYIFQKVSDFAEDPIAFLSEIYPTRDLSTGEKVDEAIDSILKDLFFHAGGTLVGKLEPRKTRLEKRASYFSNPSHFPALMFRAGHDYEGRVGCKQRLRDDFDLVSQFDELLKGGLVVDKDASVVESKEDASTGNAKGPDDGSAAAQPDVAADVVWFSTYEIALRLGRQYFDEDLLHSFNFETFRRLFFLSARLDKNDRNEHEFLSEIYDDVEYAVDEVFPTFDEFDPKRLALFFKKLDETNEDILANKTPAQIDNIALLALEIFRKNMNTDDGVEFLTSDSDFSSEYLEIAKYLVNRRFSNRQFNHDFSDFDDFYNEFLSVAGPRASVSKEEVLSYFISAGGVFSKPAEVQEEQPPQSRGEAVKRVLAERYPSGLDLFDSRELERFRQECASWGFELDSDDAKVRGVIYRNAIFCDLRAWALADELRKKIKETINFITGNKTQGVYFEALFQKNADWLTSSGVSNWRVLRSFIASCYPNALFYERYFENSLDKRAESAKILDDIVRLWGSFSSVRTVDELAGRSYISRDLIQFMLENATRIFSPRGDGFAINDDFVEAYISSSTSDFKIESFGVALPANLRSEFYGDGKTFLKLMLDEVKRFEQGATNSPETGTISRRTTASEPARSEKVRASETSRGAVVSESSVSSSVQTTTSDDDWRKRANLAAKILALHFKEGLPLSDAAEMTRFRKLAATNGLETSPSDDELAKQLKRVGFTCDDRLYVVSKKAKEVVINLVGSWFNQGGAVMYFGAFFERHQDVLKEAGVVTVEVLKNRLKKYLPECVFSADDEYFVPQDDNRTVFERLRDDLLLVWDGSSAKRVSELEKMVYAPRRMLEKALRGDHDHFEVLLNGFWKRIDAAKKPSASKKKDSKNLHA